MKDFPFQVMCISPTTVEIRKQMNVHSPVEVLREYTVVGVYTENNKVYYYLSGFGIDTVFLSTCFAILPEKSADQMSEEKHEAIIYQR